MVGPSDIVCGLRAVNSDCERALIDFHIARLTRESSSVPETGPDASSARIATSRYRTATRAKDQARLFLALEAEIKTRQEQMKLPPIDQSSKEYKAHVCAKVKAENLCPPEHYQVLCEYILRPCSDRFWDNGCPAPQVEASKLIWT